ncbi:MAG: hypothetical protein O3A51_12730 [Verrucomicrobia bacterium]|nr:hypothetical protein [Verrucomicrobiota bacterium]
MEPTTELRLVPPDRALVSFVPTATYADATRFEIWDGTNLVGLIDPGTYLQVLVEPGEHLFLGKGEDWSFVKATLAPGRQYYISATVTTGVFKSNVSLTAFKKSDFKREGAFQKVEIAMRALRPQQANRKLLAEFARPKLAGARQAVNQFASGKARYTALEHDDGR